MKAITLRNVPVVIERLIREKTRQKHIRASKAVIELLQERAGIPQTARKKRYDDLDSLAGCWSADEARGFQKVMRAIRRIDERD